MDLQIFKSKLKKFVCVWSYLETKPIWFILK